MNIFRVGRKLLNEDFSLIHTHVPRRLIMTGTSSPAHPALGTQALTWRGRGMRTMCTHSVHDKKLATDVLTRAAREKNDWTGKVFGGSPAACRYPLRDLPQTNRVRQQLLIPVWARLSIVRSQLARENFTCLSQCSLGRCRSPARCVGSIRCSRPW